LFTYVLVACVIMRIVQIRRRLAFCVVGMSMCAACLGAQFSTEHRTTFVILAILLTGLLAAMSAPQASTGGERSQARRSAQFRRVWPIVRTAAFTLGIVLFEILFLPYPMAWLPYH
jgi:hypothetical protein